MLLYEYTAPLQRRESTACGVTLIAYTPVIICLKVLPPSQDDPQKKRNGPAKVVEIFFIPTARDLNQNGAGTALLLSPAAVNQQLRAWDHKEVPPDVPLMPLRHSLAAQ